MARLAQSINSWQLMVAGALSAPLTAIVLAINYTDMAGVSNFTRSILGPSVAPAIFYFIVTIFINLFSGLLVRWFGSGLSPFIAHLAIAVVSTAGLLIVSDFIGRMAASVGGGPIGWKVISALLAGAAVNGVLILLLFRFGPRPG